MDVENFDSEYGLPEERRRLLELAVASSPNVVIITDATLPDNPAVYVNPAMERVTGYSAGEVLGRNPRFLQGPYEDQEEVAELRRAISEGREFFGVLRNRRKDGGDFWNEMYVAPVRDEDGELTHFIGLQNDVTDRVRAEGEKLKASAEYEEMIRILPNVVFRWARGEDGRTRPAYIEGALAEEFGVNTGRSAGKTVEELFPHEFVSTVAAAYERAFAGEIVKFPSRIGDRSFYNVVRPFYREGQAEGSPADEIVGFGTEVTERERTEAALRESEERFRTAFENAPIGVTLVDVDNRYIRVNRAFREMLGYAEEDLVGITSAEITHPDDVEASRAYMRRVIEGRGEGQDLEKRYFHADGSVVWVLLNAALVRDSGGEPSHYVCQHQDVTERRSFEEALRRSEGNLAEAQRIAHVGSWEYDVERDEAYWSDEMCRIFGFEPQSFVPTFARFLALVHPDDREGVRRTFAGALEEGDAQDMDYRVVRPDGCVRAVNARYEATRDEGGRTIRLAGTALDVTERKLLEEELAHRAFHDPLTDLPNRALLMDRLGQAVARKERRGGEVAVLFMDLDNFKHVNDSMGHEAGDRLLVEVSRRITSFVRPQDTVARLGGDEFAVLLEDVRGIDEATEVAGRIAGVLSPPVHLRGREIFVTPSIGVALGGDGEDRPEALLREADAAMYDAKGRGKNRHAVFRPEMRDVANRRLRLEGDLRRALRNPGEEFRVFYQPEASISSGEIVGVEALVRWEHPERGLLSPAEFVPLAEEMGLIVPLGRWVLDAACRQAVAWQGRFPAEAGRPRLKMSVNLSARQFQHEKLAGEVAVALEGAGMDPGDLILEITESVLMEDAPATAAMLRRLKDLGVGLAIDDFGTGYSSLSYLKRFPVDFVKVDRSIVDGLESDPGNAAIVAATITLSHALGLRVIAEGVETANEVEKLRELGCDLGQGYYWWKPNPPGEAATLIASNPNPVPDGCRETP